jgi:hypothetical protein
VFDGILPIAPPGPPPAGRLTLSNFSYDLADVQAILTRRPYCAIDAGGVPMDFKLPLNSTWIIPTPPGSDVCWRRLLPGPPPPGVAQATRPAMPIWQQWNRAYTATGRFIDAQL